MAVDRTVVVAGGLSVIGLMWAYGISANEPLYYGLLASLVAYVIVSAAPRPTNAAVLANRRARPAGRDPEAARATGGEADGTPEPVPAAPTG